MTVRFYSSEDVGAPVIAGTTAGQMISILDACLVNGYGGKPAAGWSRPFSGANLAAYQQGGGNGMFLRVDDTETGSNRSAYTRGFEVMTGISAGERAFPSVASLASGVRNPTAYGSSSVPRAWFVVADESAFYLWIEGTAGSTTPTNLPFFFGDVNTYHAADVSNTLMVGWSPSTQNLNSATLGMGYANSSISSTSQSNWLARRFDQVEGGVSAGLHGDYAKNGASLSFGGSSNAIPYPNPVDGGIALSRVWVHESSPINVVRGEMPGLWFPCHNRPFPTDRPVIVNGEGSLSGRQFVTMLVAAGQLMVEISDTWR